MLSTSILSCACQSVSPGCHSLGVAVVKAHQLTGSVGLPYPHHHLPTTVHPGVNTCSYSLQTEVVCMVEGLGSVVKASKPRPIVKLHSSDYAFLVNLGPVSLSISNVLYVLGTQQLCHLFYVHLIGDGLERNTSFETS